MSENKKVTICGVNFGNFYIKAIKDSENYVLKSIFSKGSEKSKKIAKDIGVDLYTKIEDIRDSDLIIMATKSMITGGKSADVIKELLKTGKDVLQEQPVHYMEVQDIVKEIKNRNQKYGVNNFYRFLPSVDIFLKYAKKLISSRKILRIRMSCASQVLYPLVEIICSMVDKVDSFEVQKGFGDNLTVMNGNINNIPFILNYYNEYTEDIDGSLALFFDISLETDAGNLILNDPEGDLIWQSHLSYSRDNTMDTEEYIITKPIQYLYRSTTKSYWDRYHNIWPEAMHKSIDYFVDTDADKIINTTLVSCKLCQDITTAAGRPQKIKVPYCNGIML